MYKIAIDADSLLYKACYRHQGERLNPELHYMEFMGEIAKIKSKVFDLYTYAKGDEVRPLIVFSPKTSFRNEMFPEYKSTRKPNTTEGIEALKALVKQRLPAITILVENVEADDIVNYMAREHNCLVAAIDKDVIHANPTHVFNYNKNKWISPKPPFQIERWYIKQALMGDSVDSIPGAKGIGEKKAEEIVDNLCEFNFLDVTDYFEDYYDALMNYRLVRMDQFDGERIVLWGDWLND